MSKDGFGWSTKMTRYRGKKSTTRGVDQIKVRVHPSLCPIGSFSE